MSRKLRREAANTALLQVEHNQAARKQEQYLSDIKDYIASVEASCVDDERLASLSEYGVSGFIYAFGPVKVAEEEQIKKNYFSSQQKVREAKERVKQARLDAKILEAKNGIADDEWLKRGESLLAEGMKSLLAEHIQPCLDILIQRAADGDDVAYAELDKFVRASPLRHDWHRYTPSYLRYLGIGLDMSKWNAFVATTVRNPARQQFDAYMEITYGDLPLRAVEALAKQDIVDAKIILACVRDDDKLRVDVGQNFIDRLYEFVAEWNCEHGLND